MIKKTLYIALLLCAVESVCGQMMENIIYQPSAVPKTVITQSDRMEFIIRNYWANYDFNDLSLIENRRYTEGAYREFVRITAVLSERRFVESHGDLLNRAKAKRQMVNHFISLSDRYYLKGDSLLIDSARYMALIERFIATKNIGEQLKKRYEARLEAMQPEVIIPEPTIAPDFEFTHQDHTESNLYSVNSRYTLLDINELGNPTSKATARSLKADSLLLSHHNVEVVSISRGIDIESWSSLKFPKWWINGCDEMLTTEESRIYIGGGLYLLDKRKRVIFERSTIEQIIDYLRAMGEPTVEESVETESHPQIDSLLLSTHVGIRTLRNHTLQRASN